MNIKTIASRIDIDWEEALEYYGGDIAMLKDKLASFDRDTEFGELEKAVASNDPEGIRKGAHRIKKASEKIGLKSLAKMAETLEKDSTDRTEELFSDLKEAYDSVIKALKEE